MIDLEAITKEIVPELKDQDLCKAGHQRNVEKQWVGHLRLSHWAALTKVSTRSANTRNDGRRHCGARREKKRRL
jgi:hypothetical protein